MWTLKEEKDGKRFYENPNTGSKCITEKIYSDKDGNDWFGFINLIALPFVRNFAAQKITSLWVLGLRKDDIDNYIIESKAILNSNDKEKYEKAYANVLEFEKKSLKETDPLKQQSALLPVFFLLNDELIDSFENSLQLRKLSLLESDPALHSFLLSKQLSNIEHYTNDLRSIIANHPAQV